MADRSSNVHALSARVARGGIAAHGAVAPGTAAEVARGLFGLTRRFDRPERERAVLERGRPFRFDGPAGVEHHAWRFGTGPKVVLVHGWQGRGSQLGAFVAPLVDAGHEVILFDAKAHGDTRGRHVDARDFADALDAIARTEGKLHAIIGHSMGGMAAAASRRLGTRANRWVVVGSPFSPEGAVDHLQRLLALSPEVVRHVRKKLSDRLDTSWDEVVGGGFFRDGEAPLLVIHDRGDDEVPFAHAERIAEAWGDAHVLATEGLGHRKILWNPEVLDRVCRFVAGESTRELEHAVGARQ
ncbi:MAG: alpha/beta hydrolase [Polyangiaceae bacterium]|nr:alpha/beta hydrolase [Polyangiaceae bacterium]